MTANPGATLTIKTFTYSFDLPNFQTASLFAYR